MIAGYTSQLSYLFSGQQSYAAHGIMGLGLPQTTPPISDAERKRKMLADALLGPSPYFPPAVYGQQDTNAQIAVAAEFHVDLALSVSKYWK